MKLDLFTATKGKNRDQRTNLLSETMIYQHKNDTRSREITCNFDPLFGLLI